MCNPAGLALASTAVGIASGKQNADTQSRYQRTLYAANLKSANENAVLSYQQIQARQEQEGAKATQAVSAAHEQAALATGRLTTTMAENNVAGNSAAALLQDFARQEANYVQTTIRNKAFLDDQFAMEMKGVEARRQAQIISGMSSPVAGPDYLNSGIKLGADVLRINWNQEHGDNPYA
jgi:fructose-1,6-bisphosphatase/inositol monophosphatase family enzyme